jgi:hypothetical protein
MVLIRAVGPSLAPLGVSGALANPQLKLFTQAGDELATNDNWPTAAKWAAVFAAAGAFPFPTGSRDAALVARLAPGAYTVQASSTDATRGVALLEIYDVPSLPAGSQFIEPVDNSAAATVQREQFDSPYDMSPRELTRQVPAVPVEFLIAGVDVKAVVQYVVNIDGTVSDSIVVRASDIRLGELSAGIMPLRTYQPARLKGQPVRTVQQMTFTYRSTAP